MAEDACTEKVLRVGISRHYEAAQQTALVLVEKIGRRILLRHKSTLSEFIMAMGMWSFTPQPNTYRDGGIAVNYIDNNDPRVKAMDDLMLQWDNELKLTGNPMRFTLHGNVITKW